MSGCKHFVLNNGTTVFAKDDGYPWMGVNRTMTERKAEKLSEDGILVEPYRARANASTFYLRIVEPEVTS